MKDLDLSRRWTLVLVLAAGLLLGSAIAPVAGQASSLIGVVVANSTKTPVPVSVRSIVLPPSTKQPYLANPFVSLSAGNYTATQSGIVGPAGRYLTVRNISVIADLPTGQRLTQAYVTFGAATHSPVFVPLTYQGTLAGLDFYAGDVSGEWLLSPGDSYTVGAQRTDNTGAASVSVGVQGYSTLYVTQ